MILEENDDIYNTFGQSFMDNTKVLARRDCITITKRKREHNNGNINRYIFLKNRTRSHERMDMYQNTAMKNWYANTAEVTIEEKIV